MAEKASLSAKQGLFLAALLAGHPIVAAVKIAHVSEQTGHRWLKDSTFSEAYKQAKNQLFEDALDELKDGMSEAIKALRKHIDAEVEPTAATNLAASKAWIEQGIQLHKVDQLEKEIAELKQLLSNQDE